MGPALPIGPKVVPDSYYHLDHALLGVEQDADGVRATFTNGRQVAGELLVGADGFRSTVRQQFLPTISPQYAGYTIWRGLAEEAALRPDIRNIVFERFAFHFPAGAEILGYPIAGVGNDLRVGKRRYNWVWYRNTSEVELKDMLTNDSGYHHPMGIPPTLIRGDVVARMRQASEITVSPPLRHVLHRIERPFFTPIYDLLSPQFAFGRVALIGDAAVVARPHVGYGTTKAAGDALSLARAVGNGSGDLATVLTHYHSDRYDLGERCFYRGQQLGAWISGAPPRTDRERGGMQNCTAPLASCATLQAANFFGCRQRRPDRSGQSRRSRKPHRTELGVRRVAVQARCRTSRAW